MGNSSDTAVGVARFGHADAGMTRFPPNVEQIRVEPAGQWLWLIVRRNDVELKMPLHPDDCAHLARLLATHAGQFTPSTPAQAAE